MSATLANTCTLNNSEQLKSLILMIKIKFSDVNIHHYHIAKLIGQSNIVANCIELQNALRIKWTIRLKKRKRL
jgi:hypothetical protein